MGMAHQRLQQGHWADNRGYRPNGNDVVMAVKDSMASLEVSQNILMVLVADLGRLHGLPLQPQRTRLRRPASDRDRKRVHYAALMVHHAGAINKKPCNYLSHWAQGTRRRLPRPTYYHFLETKSEEHPHLTWFHWIWKSNAMVFVVWWWLP